LPPAALVTTELRRSCPRCGARYADDVRFCEVDGESLTSASADQSHALLGTVVAGRFRLKKHLGQGGMGHVYLAEHEMMRRSCAIKIMKPALARDPDSLLRFRREAENAGRLTHEHVASVYDFGNTDDGLVYLAMEYVEGESLKQLLLREGSIPPARAIDIGLQIASALQAAHSLSIVHRDLKPDNIMIGTSAAGSDHVKVVDFGIARVMSSATQAVTSTGFAIGTPDFMSPEQFLGDEVDGRADIFALGLLLYRMLTAQLPWTAADAQGVIFARLNEPRKTLAELRPEVSWPRQLQDVLDGAIAVRANDRYATATELASALARVRDAWLHGRRTRRSFPTLSARQAGASLAGLAGVALVAFTIYRLGADEPPPRVQFLKSSPSDIELPLVRDSEPPPILRQPTSTPAPRAQQTRRVPETPAPPSHARPEPAPPTLTPEAIRATLGEIMALTDVRNMTEERSRRGLREAERLLPQLTRSADSVEARYYIAEALLGLERTREACQTLLAIEVASRATPFAAGVANLLQDPELACRGRAEPDGSDAR
jgi:eukaryotic-like serine/threonine-protein kinase